MDLPPFLLDQWLSRYDFADPPIAYNLASSTGPRWSVGELADLGGSPVDLLSTVMSYAPAEGTKRLRAAVAEFHGADPDWVVITTGASEALSLLMLLAERPNGNIVIPDPAYPAYAAMARAWRLNSHGYRLSAADGFQQRAETVLAATDGDTVAVIVNTPHNPTGSVMEPAEIARAAGALAERGIPLIVDEVYHPLYFGDPRPSAAGIANVIVTSDLSKALSVPGLRTGWVIDRDPVRRRRLIDARGYFTISGSPLLEQIASHVLRHRAPILDRLRAVAAANLDRLGALIDSSAGVLEWTRPQGGTTSFPRFADGRNSRRFCEDLAGLGVLVAPGDCFGHDSHMRIGFAQQADRFDLALHIVADQLARRRPSALAV